MKAKYLLIILLFISMYSFPQDKKESTILVITEDDFYWNMVKTNDELYIYSDSDNYLMDKSPLSYFEGFKELYKNKGFLEDPILISAEPGTMGHDDKVYQGIWFIKNKQLYLANINFNYAEIDDVEKGRKDQFPIMEKMTGEKFDTRYNYITLGRKKIFGLMPALWFTDTIYVKKAFSSMSKDYEIYKKDGDIWIRSAYLQMIFEKGKLVGMKGIENKTTQYDFDWKKRTTKAKP